jgi:hypothetical protein
MTTLMILQVFVSVLFFVNKVFIFNGRKTGWLIGMIAAALGAIYFHRIGYNVYVTLEFGLIVLMGYGFFKGNKKNPKVERTIQVFTVLAMSMMTIFAFSGFITLIELGSSLGLLAGAYFLTHSQIRLGWFVNAIAHLLGIILGWEKGAYVFVFFQALSVIISIMGTVRKK